MKTRGQFHVIKLFVRGEKRDRERERENKIKIENVMTYVGIINEQRGIAYYKSLLN